MANNTWTIQAKSLTALEDQMQHEFQSYVKAEHYAGTFQDASLQKLATDLAASHKQRYDRLFQYLNGHE